jgi:hypothetical protein
MEAGEAAAPGDGDLAPGEAASGGGPMRRRGPGEAAPGGWSMRT